MSMQDSEFNLELSRRELLAAAGVVGGTAAAGPLLASSAVAQMAPAAPPATALAATPSPAPASDSLATPPVAGLHLQFGGDASSEMIASWHTMQSVRKPRVMLGTLDGKLDRVVEAKETSYTDAKSGQVVYAYHAKLGQLQPDTAYLYGAVHDGAAAEFGTFRSAPHGRAKFTFTSFGDQATPTAVRKYTPPEGVKIGNAPVAYVNDNLGSPAAGDTVLGVERVAPLFHLLNGDLCYANLADDRVRTWWDFWENNSRSARKRPWMPAAGNHENELGNGPIGFQAYQTYFALPETAGQTDTTRGLWYAFTVGSMRLISLNNDDIVYQDGGNSYVRGYSEGAQKDWLEKELAAARANRDIDWVVVCMHQVAISTVDKFNGADLGIRQEWVPLFDKYGVDLVVCGHEHHYERSHPIRGAEQNQTLTPVPVTTVTDVIDTTKGTVHMVIGGGGTSVPSNTLFYDPPACRVITAVGEPDPKTGKRPPVYVKESAPWSAVRNAAHAYGFAAFTLDPGPKPGDFTTIQETYYDVVGPDGQLAPFESFTLRRPRRDA
ncbi:MAG TPA: metallophosphoesterase family protein [Stellaceae bacterium]|nr:metallophosphoesterase family protein [Stellaceae bacterium]